MKMLIDGKWEDASDKTVCEVINPATGKAIDTVPNASLKDVEYAISLAVEGQKEWGAFPLHKRLQILERYACMVEESTEKIAAIMCEEGGKPIEQCRTEIAANAAVFRIYISAANTFYGKVLPYQAEPRSTGDIAFTTHEPLGVFVNLVPFNYPVELAAHKLAPMLATGNSVVLLPSVKTPRSALIVVQLLIQAGVPARAVCCLTGTGATVGAWAVADSRVAAVSFTGSTEVGISLAKACAKRLCPVSLELGGNDALVIYNDCDYEYALQEAVNGRIGNAGQTCCASKRFLVQSGIYESFTRDLAKRLQTLKLGNPTDASVDIGPLVREEAAVNVENQIAKAVRQGAKLICGGARRGAFIEPTVLQVSSNADIANNEEVFGPVFPIIAFDTLEQAVEIANQTKYGLSSGVLTSNIKTALQTASLLQAGACIINGSGNYRLAHQPFGGYKYSGLGREGAVCTLEEVTQQKLISFKGILLG